MNAKRKLDKHAESRTAKRKHAGWKLHLPGYNYCGPGTVDFSKKPVNALDALCRQHDLDYSTIIQQGGQPYTTWNWADDKFMEGVNNLSKSFKWRNFLSMEIVMDTFGAKKQVAPASELKEPVHKGKRGLPEDEEKTTKRRHPLEEEMESHKKLTSEVDVPSATKGSINQSERIMPSTKRRTTKRPSKGRSVKGASKGSSGKKGRSNKKNGRRRNAGLGGQQVKALVAKMISPPFNVQERWYVADSSTANVSTWLDPFIYMATGPIYWDMCLFNQEGMLRAFNKVDTASTNAQCYFNYRKNLVRYTNHSNSTMSLSIFTFTCKTQQPNNYGLQLIDRQIITDASTYTGDSGNTQYNYISPRYATSSKNFNIGEIPRIHEQFSWKIKKVKLEPGQTGTFQHVDKRDYLFDTTSYNQIVAWTENGYKRGDKFFLIRWDTEIQKDHTLGFGVGYTSQGIAMESSSQCQIRKKSVSARKIYETTHTEFLGTSPQIISPAVTEVAPISA